MHSLAHAKDIEAKGVDLIACISVNDAFVMDAWGKDRGAGDKVMMLADGNADFAKAMGLEMDGKGIGFGTRSQRYSAIIENGVIKALNVEKPMKFECSSADGPSFRKRLTTHHSRPCGSSHRCPSPQRLLSSGSGLKTATGSDHVRPPSPLVTSV